MILHHMPCPLKLAGSCIQQHLFSIRSKRRKGGCLAFQRKIQPTVLLNSPREDAGRMWAISSYPHIWTATSSSFVRQMYNYGGMRVTLFLNMVAPFGALPKSQADTGSVITHAMICVFANCPFFRVSKVTIFPA